MMEFAFLEVSLASAALILLILALTPLLKKRYSMKWRYWAWMLVGVRLLIPFAVRWGPQVEIPLRTPPAALPSVSQPVGYDPGPPLSAPEGGTGTEAPSPPPAVSAPQTASETTGGTGASAPALSWPPAPWVVWATGAVFCLVYHLAGWVLFSRSVRRRRPPPGPEFAALLERCRAETGVRRAVSLALCKGGSPMAVGILRPVILLPENVCGLPEADLRMILLHELTHLRRRDMERKLLLLLAACVHWFNPLVWVMVRSAGRDIEATCDDAVLAKCGPSARGRYSRLLLIMAGDTQPFPSA